MNKICTCFSRLDQSLIVGYSAVILLALVPLLWSTLAFCNDIHEEAYRGDIKKVRTLLKSNALLVSSRGKNGMTPLHWAVLKGHKDMAELLLQHGAIE